MAASERVAQPRPSLVGPVILIGLGVIFLLNNLGILSWNIWNSLWRFWPLLLIAAGLDLLFGRRSTMLSALFALLMAATLGFGVWYLNNQAAAGAANLVVQSVAYPADTNVTRAQIELAPSVGELRINAMREADGLVSGTIAAPENVQVARDYSVSNGVAYLTLRERNDSGPDMSNIPFGENRRWDLSLNPEIPVELSINGGVGNTNLDLAQIQLTKLNLDTGVGSITVTLPAQGVADIAINGGVGATVVRIPAGMAARIEVSRGVGAIDIASEYGEQGDDLYVSRDYETNPNRVDVRINGGVGSITVERIVMP